MVSSLEDKLSATVSSASYNSSILSSLPDGTFVGLSSCDRFTSTLGSGQKVLSYAYFTPWNKEIKQNYT